MATFVTRGFLRFPALVPDELNARALEEIRKLAAERFSPDGMRPPDTGTPLDACYPPPSAIGEVLRLPEVAGLIESLVGPDPTFDSDWTHHVAAGTKVGQLLHVDAITDTLDPTFDIQLFYFPHAVGEGEGGTRFVPGTHLHHVCPSSLERYQRISGEKRFVGPAGTILVFHHGMWHAGEPNQGAEDRWMYKIRINPTQPQVRRWNTADLEELHNDPSDHIFARARSDSVAQVFRAWQPFLSVTGQRNEQVQRARLWRYLTGDERYDVDHYLTRLEQRARMVAE